LNLNIELNYASKAEWIECVLNNFNAFLIDHADCERKASGMAMGFVAKYPNRNEIIPERNIALPAKMEKDEYITLLMKHCRNGRDERMIDNFLIASVVECRGAERFKLIYENIEDKDLKKFYKMLWASEAKHGNIFVKMLFNYFDEKQIYNRLHEFVALEAEIMRNLKIRPALH